MPKTLLAVDDSATMRKVLEITFAGEDFRVLAAENSQRALAQMSQEPAAVVIDTSLGGDDAYALAKEVRSRDARAAILLMSSRYNPLRRRARQERRGGRLHRETVRHAKSHRQGQEGDRRARDRRGRSVLGPRSGSGAVPAASGGRARAGCHRAVRRHASSARRRPRTRPGAGPARGADCAPLDDAQLRGRAPVPGASSGRPGGARSGDGLDAHRPDGHPGLQPAAAGARSRGGAPRPRSARRRRRSRRPW